MVRRLAVFLALVIAAVPTLLAVSAAGPRTTSPRTVTIGMGYVPNVQFAPFYVAQARGYYRRAGLNVVFNYATSPNLVELVGAGKVDFANADGTDVAVAVAHGVPVTYVMAEYQRLPVAIFALAKRHIRRPLDLCGTSIGLPGEYGSTFVGLRALERVARKESAGHSCVFDEKAIGYTQTESVADGKVDAAVGYSTNEPILLARRGYRVSTIEVSTWVNLVGAGLIAGTSLTAHDPALVRAFVQATAHGLADTIRDPKEAFAIARHVNGLTTLQGRDVGDQYAVLQHTISFWHSDATRRHGLGYADGGQWTTTLKVLKSIGQLSRAPRVTELYTNSFTRGGPRL